MGAAPAAAERRCLSVLVAPERHVRQQKTIFIFISSTSTTVKVTSTSSLAALTAHKASGSVRGRHVRGSQDRLDYEITVGGASLRLGYVPGTTFICPSAKWHRQKICSSPIGTLPRISGHHSAQFWALRLRHAINRTARSDYRSPVRHPPVHALDSIILQAQVPTPSGG